MSRSAVEFFRLFPAAHDRFEVGTAARLSATFPYVSPGVSLPTDPPRRVVDAGYFDNYGVNLAALLAVPAPGGGPAVLLGRGRGRGPGVPAGGREAARPRRAEEGRRRPAGGGRRR